VHRCDERLSTVEASRAMRAAGAGSRKQRGVVDKVAAAIVLGAYLDAHRAR
jgi:putative Holliday junction resolvase